MNLSDRDVQIGIINMIGALAKKLTGEEMVVKVFDEEGNHVTLSPSTRHARFVEPEPATCGDGKPTEPIADPLHDYASAELAKLAERCRGLEEDVALLKKVAGIG